MRFPVIPPLRPRAAAPRDRRLRAGRPRDRRAVRRSALVHRRRHRRPASLLRIQGFGVMARVRRPRSDAGRDPGRELAHGVMILLAGVLLLIIPGFVTDIIGAAAVPAAGARRSPGAFLKRRVVVVDRAASRLSADGGTRASATGRSTSTRTTTARDAAIRTSPWRSDRPRLSRRSAALDGGANLVLPWLAMLANARFQNGPRTAATTKGTG